MNSENTPNDNDMEFFSRLIDLEYKKYISVDSDPNLKIWTKFGLIEGHAKKSIIASLIKEDTIGRDQAVIDDTVFTVKNYVEEIRESSVETLPCTLIVTTEPESWSQIFLSDLEVNHIIINKNNLQKAQQLTEIIDSLIITPKFYMLLCQHTSKYAWRRVIFDRPEQYSGNILRPIIACFAWVYTENLVDLISFVQDKNPGNHNFLWDLLMNGKIIDEKYNKLIISDI